MKISKKAQDAFFWICNILTQEKIDFVISGGLAAKAYGSGRPLFDIDIDLNDDDFRVIAQKFKTSPFLVYGPAIFKDEKWEILLLTLKYKEQYIDICGSSSAKIYSEEKGVWVEYPFQPGKSTSLGIAGYQVKVIPKNLLIQYKSILGRGVDSEDIKFMK